MGVDIGGTFTDVVFFDEARNTVALAKALTTPAELARGVQDALAKAAVPLGGASLLIHGSTIVVNAIVERKGARTALVTTQGFRDIYEIGRINRPESFNPRFRKHRPLVPRERVADPLGGDLERAASGMLEVAVAAMANAVRHVTLERGLDPRDFTLIAYGGAGPLHHAAAVARELAIRTVVIPPAPGHFSALGMLMADLRRDYVQTLFERLNDLSMEGLEAQFQQLEVAGREALRASGIATDRIVFERAADMRYVGQEHAVTVRLPSHVTDEASRQEIKRLFDEAHEQRFNHSAPEESADVVSLRVSAIGLLSKPSLPTIAQGGCIPPEDAHRGTRGVVFDKRGAVPAQVFDRAKLLQGNVIEGPALIEEEASVTVLGPGDSVEVNAFGHLVMSLEETPG